MQDERLLARPLGFIDGWLCSAVKPVSKSSDTIESIYQDTHFEPVSHLGPQSCANLVDTCKLLNCNRPTVLCVSVNFRGGGDGSVAHVITLAGRRVELIPS